MNVVNVIMLLLLLCRQPSRLLKAVKPSILFVFGMGPINRQVEGYAFVYGRLISLERSCLICAESVSLSQVPSFLFVHSILFLRCVFCFAEITMA